MGTDRLKRVNELLKREIAQLLYRVLNEQGVDLSALTVTRVETSPNLRHARVMISIFGHHDQRDEILSTVKRHRKEIQHLVGKHVKLKYTPKLSFELDDSLEEGDNILRIIQEIEDAQPAPEEADAPPPETSTS